MKQESQENAIIQNCKSHTTVLFLEMAGSHKLNYKHSGLTYCYGSGPEYVIT